MAVATAIDFKAEVRELFARFDRQDWKGIKALLSDDPQGVDEISRRWLRGKGAIDGYFAELQKMGVDGIRSKPSDFAVKQYGDVALVTCMVDQRYEADGADVSITAPVSVLFHRRGAEWKIESIHAVALPEAA